MNNESPDNKSLNATENAAKDALDDALESAEDLAEMIDEAEDLVDASDDGITADGESIEEEKSELELALEAAETKATEHHENLLRMAAEMDNLRKRTTREVDQARKFAVERFAKEVLLVKDSLDLGVQASQVEDATVESIREGMEMTLKQLDSTLGKFSLTQIKALGEVFNPEFHEAMAMQPSTEHEPNSVMLVMQEGYLLNERVLRPARVIVSKEADEPSE